MFTFKSRGMIHIPLLPMVMLCMGSFALGSFATVIAAIIILKPGYDKK